MNPQTFFDHFEQLADAPNAVPRFREMILQLAVQGKLVEQDARDEPASRLLERIAAERKRLVREKKIKEAKPLPPISDNEKPFDIPDSWRWVRLSEVGYDWGQKKPDVEFTYIDVAAIDNESGVISSEIKVLHPDEAPSRARKIVKQGTVIYSTVRPYLLNIAIVDKQFEPEPIASTAFAVIHPFTSISAKYLFFYLRSKPFIEYIENQMKGVAYPAINDEGFFSGRIPLPPLEEQKRIVAEVDELMRLCDELEREQAERRASRSHLNRTALEQLLAARDAAEFRTRWQTVCNHFPTLTASPDLLGKLRQTVLQLAVQGKLTQQDPQDEPATSLLRRIRAEKEQLIKEKRSKRTDSLLPVNPDEMPFDLPTGWMWARLEELTETITKGSSPKWQGINYTDASTGVLFITSENVRNYALNVSEPKYVEAKFNEIEPRSILKHKDILMNIVGASIGRTALYDLDKVANINQAVCLIRLIKPEILISLDYMLHFFNSETCISLMFDKQVENARANLSMGNIAKFPIPFPPLEEQKRIVAAVNRLMALCDELDANLRQAEEDGERLLRAAVRSLLASGSENSAAKVAALVVQ